MTTLVELHGRHLRPLGDSSAAPFIGRICERVDLPRSARAREVLLLRGPVDVVPDAFRSYLFLAGAEPSTSVPEGFALAAAMSRLREGDVVRIDPKRRHVHALYRRQSPSNSFLVTERCDNYCLMCSQPPRDHDDGWLVDELMDVIPLVSPDTREIGITGGEPALLGPRLVELVDMLKRQLPRTAVHVLSNGRRFSDRAFARALAKVRHPDLMIGVPLYSDLPEEHDYVVQARGAFNETVRGIIELKRNRVRVELRFVIHAETADRLPDFARFVARNLLFADHVALMGLEPTGFAKTNFAKLWIDPLDYQRPLAAGVDILDRAGLNVSIYNHQLCVLDERLHAFARRSISDWKNVYFGECEGCVRRSECGGFFASSNLGKSRGIARVADAAAALTTR